MKVYLCHNRTELPRDLWEEKGDLPRQSAGYKRFTTQDCLRLNKGVHSLEQWEGIEHRLKENEKCKATERAKILKGFGRIYIPEVEKEIGRNLEEKAKERISFKDKYCQRIGTIDVNKYPKNDGPHKEIEPYCERIKEIDANKFLEAVELRRQERIKERRKVSEYLDKILGPRKLTH